MGAMVHGTYTAAYEERKRVHDHDVYDYFGIEVLLPKNYDEFEDEQFPDDALARCRCP